MKKIAIIALILLAFACKKKDTKPAEPGPDPVPTCQTGFTVFAGNYTDQNGSKISIVWLKNNCPTQNSNTYRIDGLADAINKGHNPPLVYSGTKYEFNSTEDVSGYATLSGDGGKFTRQKGSTGEIVFTWNGVYLKFAKE